MKASDDIITFIANFEGWGGSPYLCSGGIATIGFGHTSNVKMTDPPITREQGLALLKKDIERFERAVSRLVTVPINQSQFDALVSFAFNLGEGALGESTLLRKLNAGDYVGAADQFLRWNKAGGRVLAGLTRRRKAERDWFLKR